MGRLLLLASALCLIFLSVNGQTINQRDTVLTVPQSKITKDPNQPKISRAAELNPVLTRGLLYGTVGAVTGYLVSIPVVRSMKREPGDPGILQSIAVGGLTGFGGICGFFYGANSGFEKKQKFNAVTPDSIPAPVKTPGRKSKSEVYFSFSPGYSQIKTGWKNSTGFSIISNPWQKAEFFPGYYSIEVETATWSVDSFSGRESRLGVAGIYKFPLVDRPKLMLVSGLGGGIAIAKQEGKIYYLPYIAGAAGAEVHFYDLIQVGILGEFQPAGAHYIMMNEQFAFKQLFSVKAVLGLKVLSY